MVKLTKLRKSVFSLILIFSLLISSFGYTPPVHAANDAYSLIEAESFSSKSGSYLKIESSPDGGQSVGGTNDGQYLVYNNLDFGSGTNGATKFSARLSVKGSNAGGNIEIRLDSPTGTLAGTLAVTATATDNWNVYQTQSADLANVIGVHDVYLVLKVEAGKTYVANINWVQFSKTLNSIAITTMPNKLAYSVGESLDITGIVVTGSYMDGSTRTEEVRVSDISGFNSSTATASQTLTVGVRGKTATYIVRIGGNSAYSVTEAESFSSKSGDYLKVESCPDGGQSVGGTNDGQYLVYNNIDFGTGSNGATKFSARLSVKGSNAGGNIEVRLDSPTGTLAGTLAVTATAPDNWNVYQTQSTDLVNVTGVHNVYLVLKVATVKTFVANINWFQFSKTLNSIAVTTPPTKTSYRIGESLDLTGLAVTGTYIDGSTRVEQVRVSDVSGFNSSTAAASQKLTVNVRGKTATFTVEIKSKTLTSITSPAAITGVVNGTAPTPAALGLPSTVVLVTDNGNVNTFVNWNIAASGYNTAVKTGQSFTVPGTVDLPSSISNPNNVPLSISVNVTVLAAASPDKDTSYKFSFMAFSDTHGTVQGDPRDIALDNAMKDAVSNNAGSVSVAGDITDYGTDAQYDVVMNTMNKYPQVEKNFAYGNHDVRWLGGYEIAKSRFMTHTGMPGIYFDKWINGYHFIYLGSETDDKDSAYMSDTQLEWLKAKLAENASKDKPIFLFIHQPLKDTVSMSHANEGYFSDEAQDQKVKDIVGQYPQSILITGHLHNDIKIPGNLYNEQYFTMIRDGAVVVTSNPNQPGAQALIFDIYADKIVINGRDVNTRSTIASWTITNYTTDALSADTQAPTVPTNVTSKVVTDTMVTLSWDKATDNFNGNVGVIGYDVYNGNTLIGSTTGSTSYKVTGLTANTAYQFIVKARDKAGNASAASSPFNVTTLAYDPAATNLVLNKTATSNGNVTGYDPSKAIDGKTLSGSKWSSSTNGDKWLMVDLGQNYNIARWVVKHAGEGGETASLNTRDYKLQGSLDGSVWKDLDSIIGNVSNSSDRYIAISTVRYVRLYITNGQNAFENEAVNIYEFEVYGAISTTLQSITAPATVIGLANGTAKTAEALGLPPSVVMTTSRGNVNADVAWSVVTSDYDPAVKTEQTFMVDGTVSLPAGVANPNNIPLTTNISVTVNAVVKSLNAVLSGNDKTIAGASFDLTYGLQNVVATIYAQDLTINYDPAKVEFVSANSLRDGFVIVEQKDDKAGQVRLLAASIGDGKGVNTDSDLLVLHWKAKSSLQTASAIFTIANTKVADGTGAEIQLNDVSHSTQIIAVTSKDELKALIGDAQRTNDGAVEGTQPHQYPTGSKAILQAAINKAKVVADNEMASQQQVDQAVVDLNTALQTFRDSVIQRISEDINDDGIISIGDLAIVARYYGITSADPKWEMAKIADIDGNGIIEIIDLSMVASKILAN